MPRTGDARGAEKSVMTVNEAAYVAGVSVKVVNQAIDREHIRTRELPSFGDATDPAGRGVSASDTVFLRVHRVLAPEYRRKLYRSIRGKSLADIPMRVEMESIMLDLERPIREIGERLQVLTRIDERVEIDPEVRGGEPVFRGSRTPVYAIARKIALGSSPEELREDYPHLRDEDFDLAARYAELHPRRGRPRAEWTGGLEPG